MRTARAELGRALATGRLLYGAALLGAPDAVLRDAAGVAADRDARVFARVLGARQLAEALAVGTRPRSRLLRTAGAGVDLAHAATAVWLASRLPSHARALHRNAALAAAFAGLGAAAR